jgi:hypothetical protein
MKCVCGYEGHGFSEFNEIKMVHNNCLECNILKPCGKKCAIIKHKKTYACPKCGTLKIEKN